MDPFEPTPTRDGHTPQSRKPSTIHGHSGNMDSSPGNSGNDGVKSRKKMWLVGGIVIGVIILAIAAILIKMVVDNVNEADRKQQEIEQLRLANEQLSLQNEYTALDNEFQGYENQMRAITDDTVKRQLTEKYNAAKLRVEQLLSELNNEKAKSAAQIKQLKDEIDTLRGILRHYVEEIDRLNKENAALRDENNQVKEENARLSSQVRETAEQNEHLSERMSLAEKLNVTGVSLTALNSKGKVEKKVKKARQLRVVFTIPQNNSTPVGEKTIYLRITSPAGNLLGGDGTFPFEGTEVPFTARKVIEYAGEELSGVTIYWDVNTALDAGEYTVELFADNYRLASRSFTLK